jgi:hypothetical protein
MASIQRSIRRQIERDEYVKEHGHSFYSWKRRNDNQSQIEQFKKQTSNTSPNLLSSIYSKLSKIFKARGKKV